MILKILPHTLFVIKKCFSAAVRDFEVSTLQSKSCRFSNMMLDFKWDAISRNIKTTHIVIHTKNALEIVLGRLLTWEDVRLKVQISYYIMLSMKSKSGLH